MITSYDKMVMTTAGIVMLLFGGIYGYMRTRKECQTPPVRALACKAAATCMAAGTGFYTALRMNHIECWLLFCALLFCAAADVVLELEFKKGALVFGVAHICLIIAFWLMSPPKFYTWLLFAMFYLCSLLLFWKGIAGLGDLRLLAVSYMGILCFMVSMALTVFTVTLNGTGKMIALGAMCFFVSDCIIGWRVIHSKNGVLSGAAILLLYYLAVYLLGSSFIFYS